MKKCILLLIPLLVLCILCSCAPHAGESDHTDSANPSQENGSAPEDSLQPEPCDCVEIYSDGTVSLQLFYGVDYETGKRTMILLCENTGEKNIFAKIPTPVINGVFSADDWYESLSPGEATKYKMDMYNEALYYAGESAIRSISGKVQLSAEWSGEPYTEKDFQAVFEKEGRGFLWDWSVNNQIPTQVLLNNDRCKLTLICMGWDTLKLTGNKYTGILYAENKTDAELPVKINGMTVNGRNVNVARTQTSIPPESAAYISFNCLKHNSLEEQRISGVNSVSLLIMTDQEENTGTWLFQSGGSWYPLKIENPDSVTEPPVEEGTVLMDMNGVRIRLLEPTPQKVEYYYSDEIYYVWKLYAENDTEENIDIDLMENIVNGKALDNSDREQPSFDCGCIAPGCSKFFEMKSVMYPLNTACPEISGVFRVYVYGKSRILFDSERVTFPNEGEIHDSVGE